MRTPVALPPDADQNSAQHQRGAPREDKPKITDWIQAGSAFFTLLATFALVWIGYNQRRISADQAEIMAGQRDISREQTAIIREQAHTARILADLEQPALFVYRVDPIETPNEEGARPSARVHIANYGRTPAVLLRVEADIITLKGPPGLPEYGDQTDRKDVFQVVEAGGAKALQIDIAGRPVPGIAARVPGGLYVYGRLIYRDPLGWHGETGFGEWLGSGPTPGRPWFAAYNYQRGYEPGDQIAPHVGYER